MSVVVSCNGVVKRYRGRKTIIALDYVSLEVHEGDMFCLVGPNGAGKTTLIECLTGIKKYDEGEILLFNRVVRGKLPSEISKLIGIHLEGSELHPWLTVEENLRLITHLNEIEIDQDYLNWILKILEIEDIYGKLYKKLSLGQKRRAELAAALITKPKLLILDEPMSQLDLVGRKSVMNILRELNKSGFTVIYTTHHLDIAQEYSNKIGILHKGKLIAFGDTKSLLSSYEDGWKLCVKAKKEIVIPGIELRRKNNCLTAEFSNIRELVGAIKSLYEQHHNEILRIEIKKTSLEEVYLSLVGGE